MKRSANQSRKARVIFLATTRVWSSKRNEVNEAYLLHDTGLALWKGNVSAGFILNKFDIYLPPLATGLVVVIIIVVGVVTDARSFDTAILSTCYAITVTGRSLVLDGWGLCGVGKVSHSRERWEIWKCCYESDQLVIDQTQWGMMLVLMNYCVGLEREKGVFSSNAPVRGRVGKKKRRPKTKGGKSEPDSD